MSSTPRGPVAHIARQAGEGESVWFFGALTTIKADGATTGGRVMVSEHLAPRGSGSPLHVHRREDEWFYVLEGELTIMVGDTTVVAGPGAFVFGPRDVPHTFIVSSDRALYLVVTEPAGFEGFIRAASEPATVRDIPPPPGAPPDMRPVMRAAADHGLEILGPPGIPG